MSEGGVDTNALKSRMKALRDLAEKERSDSHTAGGRADLNRAIAAAQGRPSTPDGGAQLYEGMAQVERSGRLGGEAARQLSERARMMDTRIIGILTTIDVASKRILDGTAYIYDADGHKVDPAPTENLTVSEFKHQLEETTRAAGDFAKLVEVLPRDIAHLIIELTAAEDRLYASVTGSELPAMPHYPDIAAWNPGVAEQFHAKGEVDQSLPVLPDEPHLEQGAHEIVRGLGVSGNLLDAIRDAKRRIDAQVIQIIHTIDDVMSRALDDETFETAYVMDGNTIRAREEEQGPGKDPIDALQRRLMLISTTAHDLIDITKRLPQEIEQLIKEVRDSDQNYLAVLNK